jgi:methionine-rich copper-binding protein CopC
VTDAAGARSTFADALVSKEDARRLSPLSLPPLQPGRYSVKFRVLSVDGHVVESTLTFHDQEPMRTLQSIADRGVLGP